MSLKKNIKTSSKEITTEHIHCFFDGLITQIENDKTEMLIGTATDEKSAMYEKFIRKDKESILNEMWDKQSLNILSEMFEKYVNKLITLTVSPKKTAFSFNIPNTISIFAVTADNDRDLAMELILAEAEIASVYSKKGFKFNSIIFEESDNMTIPHGYYEFKVTK